MLHLQRKGLALQLTNCALFQGIASEDIDKLLQQLNAKSKKYKKNDSIILTEQHVQKLGIMLSGRAWIKKEDTMGEVSIITQLLPSDIFAEALVCAGVEKSPVTVLADEDTTVLWLDIKAILNSKNLLPAFLLPFYFNLLQIIAQKNVFLNDKIRFLSFKTTKLKIINFLFDRYKANKTTTFKINFNRSELAEYLCTDRSALSRELGKLKKQGVLDFKKNTFILKDKFFQLLN